MFQYPTMMDGDLVDRGDIDGVMQHTDSIDSRLREVDFQIERLLMVSEALWDILKEDHGYDDTELMRRVASIDMKDGKLDGRVHNEAPQNCPKCDRVMGRHRSNCIYCGSVITRTPFERD
jgi:hypothetical protein